MNKLIIIALIAVITVSVFGISHLHAQGVLNPSDMNKNSIKNQSNHSHVTNDGLFVLDEIPPRDHAVSITHEFDDVDGLKIYFSFKNQPHCNESEFICTYDFKVYMYTRDTENTAIMKETNDDGMISLSKVEWTQIKANANGDQNRMFVDYSGIFTWQYEDLVQQQAVLTPIHTWIHIDHQRELEISPGN